MSAATLRFPRPLGDIIRDIRRILPPRRYDKLLDEYERHPEVVAVDPIIAQQDAIESLLDEQDRGWA